MTKNLFTAYTLINLETRTSFAEQPIFVTYFSVCYLDVEGRAEADGSISNMANQSGFVELAAILVSYPFKILAQFTTFIKPQGQIGWYETKNIHGLTATRGTLRRHSVPQWSSVRTEFEEFIRRHRIENFCGVGRDILDLVSSLQIPWAVTHYDLALPTWRERETANYTALFQLTWRIVGGQQEAACVEERHDAYCPNARFRERYAHKLWYGVHCAYKDCVYMIVAASRVPMSRSRVCEPPVNNGSLILLNEHSTMSLEGMLITDPMFFKLAAAAVAKFSKEVIRRDDFLDSFGT